MLYTPRPKKKNSTTTDHSATFTQLPSKYATHRTRQSLNTSTNFHLDSSRDKQIYEPVAKLNIQVKKKKVDHYPKQVNAPKIRTNYVQYRSKDIVSKMSTQQHGNIYAYGVSSFKGPKNLLNPHHLSINLGKVKNMVLCQSFDGGLAAKIVKQQFSNILLEYELKEQEKPDITLKQTFKKLQQIIMNHQAEIQDNSCTTLISLLIRKDLTIVANTGCSQVLCQTKNGSYLRLSEPHTTTNKKQVHRVIKNGGRIYQTVVNVPFQQELELQGPMRLSPSGLMITRCLGRTMDIKTEMKKIGFSSIEQSLNLTWKPQIRYIKTDEVFWIGIFSESIVKNISIDDLRSIVKIEIKKKSEFYTEHHISSQISRKIIDKLACEGINQAMSCIILFLAPVQSKGQENRYVGESSKERTEQRTCKLNNTLKYIGNRSSFVKSVDSKPKVRSLSKIRNQSSKQKRRI